MKTANWKARLAETLPLLICALLLGAAASLAQNQGQKKTEAQPQTKSPPATNAKAAPAHPGHSLGMKFEKRDGQGKEGSAKEGAGKDGTAIVITELDEGGPAARAGLREKDQFVSIDQRQFSSPRQLLAYLSSSGGRQIQIVVLRDGQQQMVLYTPPFRSGDSAWLGVFLEEDQPQAKGATITQVYPDGPAARAGLHPGDVVVQIDDEKITSPSDLVAVVTDSAPQKEAKFMVLRNEKQETVPVTFGAHHQQGAVQFAHPQNTGPQDQQGQAQNGFQAFDTIPPYAMRLEHDRRSAEQHQRIEEEIHALREEIHQLREDLKQSKK